MPTMRRPRSRRRSGATVELTPAVRFAALTGFFPNDDTDPEPQLGVVLAGWLDLYFRIGSADLGDALAPFLEAHGEELAAEAKRAGFTPWFQSREHPTGAAYRRWRTDLAAEHINNEQ